MASRVKSWCLRRWAPIASALLYLLAFPPLNLWPLVFIALVPMLRQIRQSDGKEAFRIGYIFGFIVFFGQMAWVDTLAVHWTHNLLLGLIPWVISAFLCGFFFGWGANLMRHCYARNWLIVVPVAWVGIEVARSYVPVLAFPWSLAATPLYRVPLLIQSAHFGTIYLVSAFVVLINVVVAALSDPALRARAYAPATGCLVVLGLSAFQLVSNQRSISFPMTIAQPGVNMAFGSREERPAKLARSIDAISDVAREDGTRLLILPEGIYQDPEYPPQTLFRVDKQLPVLFGGERGIGPTYQTAFSFDGRWHYADKTRLVIFGEFVPGRDTFPFIAKWFDLPADDLSASKAGVKSVDVAGVRAGPMLCFEGLFTQVAYEQARNGAQFIAVMCIDDWYLGTSAPEQLKAASVFRAVETGLPVARSASMGYTMAIDAHGRILAELPLEERGALRVNLKLPTESPLFPLLPVFPIVALLFIFVAPWLPGRPRKAKSG